VPAFPAPAANSARAATGLRSETGDAIGVYSRADSAARTQQMIAVIDLVWVLGSALCFVPVALGAWQLRQLRRRGIPWLAQRARAGAAGFGIDARIELLLHEQVAAPLTFGFRKPTIVLPTDVEEWSDADLRRSLAHEREHIRRHDWITQAIARIICGVYWFHPLVWIACARLSVEAERACDDAAIQSTGTERAEYAAQLVSLARRMAIAPTGPVLGLANRSDLTRRVSALLDDTQRRGRAGLSVLAPICLCSAILVVAVAPIQLIAQLPVPREARTSGLPLYPGAKAKPEQQVEGPHRASLNLDHLEVSEAWAGKYQSDSDPSEVAAFYRKSLKSFGTVTECSGGRNQAESVRIGPEFLQHPTSCNPMEFGEGETELKAAARGEFWMVTIQPREAGSQFTLVHIRDVKPTGTTEH
jgi:beta-lactamase regulating signal transducer with metallopeptidase domain